MPLSLDNGGIDRLTRYFWCYEDIYSYDKFFLKAQKNCPTVRKPSCKHMEFFTIFSIFLET